MATSTSSAPQALPPQAVVMQMAMGAWVAKVIAETPAEYPRHRPSEWPNDGGAIGRRRADVTTGALERLMRAARVSAYSRKMQRAGSVRRRSAV